MDTTARLNAVLNRRANILSRELTRRLSAAHDLVVFGSFAAGLQNATSDLDVFCIGDTRTHFKTKRLEILILPEHDVYSELWLGSELANHISYFGVPLHVKPRWFEHVQISDLAIHRKAKRICAYASALEMHWERLGQSAKLRYEHKLRRELQRYEFLERNQPVPQTKILDSAWEAGRTINRERFRVIPEQKLMVLGQLFPSFFK